jgi:hypothetical protein
MLKRGSERGIQESRPKNERPVATEVRISMFPHLILDEPSKILYQETSPIT